VFIGRTRAERHDINGALLRLEYDAHAEMSIRVLRELAEAAAATFGCRMIRLEHALGPVAVGEASVIIRVACPHRGASFAACQQLIDALKRVAPIWKREIWERGASWAAGAAVVPTSETAARELPSGLPRDLPCELPSGLLSGLPRKSTAQRARAARLYDALQARHPDARCELLYHAPHELLVATILSAQATDVGVNKATPALFKAFPTPADYARATPEQIEPYVRSLGFFRSKAKAVHESMRRVHEVHGGAVPCSMEELLKLRGVARKTANVVLSNAFGIHEGVVVDTHVMRLSQRFGLTTHQDPAKIERDLMALFPRERWGQLSHLLIWHGRRTCKARGGQCATDPICQEFHRR